MSLTMRNADVDAAELALIEANRRGASVMTAADFPVRNFFAPGLYARMLSRPAGTFIVGHAHKTAHLSILLKGRLRVLVEGRVKEIVGPSDPFLTEAGLRKATYAVEDSTLITFHPTDETDMGRLEEELVQKSTAFQDFEAGEAIKRLRVANFQTSGLENLAPQ